MVAIVVQPPRNASLPLPIQQIQAKNDSSA
jgi:hypothetical protein